MMPTPSYPVLRNACARVPQVEEALSALAARWSTGENGTFVALLAPSTVFQLTHKPRAAN
jgi:hypothetical protein